jgi:hypothetical protein
VHTADLHANVSAAGEGNGIDPVRCGALEAHKNAGQSSCLVSFHIEGDANACVSGAQHASPEALETLRR